MNVPLLFFSFAEIKKGYGVYRFGILTRRADFKFRHPVALKSAMGSRKGWNALASVSLQVISK